MWLVESLVLLQHAEQLKRVHSWVRGLAATEHLPAHNTKCPLCGGREGRGEGGREGGRGGRGGEGEREGGEGGGEGGREREIGRGGREGGERGRES